MTSTPVGMRCPECARQRTKVRTARHIGSEPRVTAALIAINVIAFLAGGSFTFGSGPGGGSIYQHGDLFGPAITGQHEYWRLVTSGFLHAGLLHIGFNMYWLYLLGRILEPELGSVRFAAVYLVSLLAGSFGALLVSPDAHTVGASGAVFGLLGVGLIEERARGIRFLQGQFGGMILILLLFSLLPGISIGGHIGGLLGGLLAGGALQLGARARSVALQLGGCLVVAAAAVAGSIAVAGGSVLSG
jgi:membrane associated rhomboid family serine protease